MAVERIRVEWDIDVTTPDNIADQWAEVGRNIGIAEDRARGLGQQFQQERGILGKLIDQEKKLRREREASNDPERIREINEELEEVRSSTEALTGTVKKQGNAWKKLAGFAAGALGAAAVVSFGKNAVQSAARFETLQISFETFLGSATEANKVLADLEKFSISTPFTPEQVQDAGRALLAFGEPVDTLKDSLKDIGDISAGTGKDFGELATLFGKARVAGTLYAEDINQLIEAGVPVLDEFASILGVSASEVKKLASEGKVSFGTLQTAFKNMTSEGGRFAGLTERLAGSTAGQISTLQGNFANLARTIGKVLLPAVTSVVGFFNRLLSGSQDVTQSYRDQIVELERTRASLDILVPQLKDTTLTENERAAVIKQINTIYPDLNKQIDLQTASEQELDAALKDVNKTISKNIELLQFQAAQALALERLNESLKQNADSVVKLGALFSDVSDEAALRELFGHEQAAAFEAFTGTLDDATAKLALVRTELRKAGALDATLPLEQRVNALDDALGKLPATVEFASGGVVDSLRGLVEEFRSGRAGVSGFSEILQTIQGQAADAGLDLDGLADSAEDVADAAGTGGKKRKKGAKSEMEKLREEMAKAPKHVEITRTGFAGLAQTAEKLSNDLANKLIPGTREYIDAQKELDAINAQLADPKVSFIDAFDPEAIPSRLEESIPTIQEYWDRIAQMPIDAGADIATGLGLSPDQIANTLGSAAALGNDIGGLFTALSDRRISDLDKEEQAALKRAGDNAAQREKIEEDFAKKREELQRKQAEQQKALAIFETIINTSAAIIKALALGNIPLSIFAGAQGALQLATIAAQPIPFYHGGLVTEGREDRDSVPAVLRKGEFVLTPDKYRAHKELIDRIHAGRALMLPSFGGGTVTVNTQEFNDKRLLKALETQTAELIRNRRAMTGNGPIGRRYNARRGY